MGLSFYFLSAGCDLFNLLSDMSGFFQHTYSTALLNHITAVFAGRAKNIKADIAVTLISGSECKPHKAGATNLHYHLIM